MLDEAIPTTLPTRLIVAADAFGFADAETAAALQPTVRTLSKLMKEVREDLLAPPGLSVRKASSDQRVLLKAQAAGGRQRARCCRGEGWGRGPR